MLDLRKSRQFGGRSPLLTATAQGGGMAPASAWYGGGESPGSRPERGERLTVGTQKEGQTLQNGQSDSYEHPKLDSVLPIVEVGVKSAGSCKMGSAGTLWST